MFCRLGRRSFGFCRRLDDETIRPIRSRCDPGRNLCAGVHNSRSPSDPGLGKISRFRTEKLTTGVRTAAVPASDSLFGRCVRAEVAVCVRRRHSSRRMTPSAPPMANRSSSRTKRTLPYRWRTSRIQCWSRRAILLFFLRNPAGKQASNSATYEPDPIRRTGSRSTKWAPVISTMPSGGKDARAVVQSCHELNTPVAFEISRSGNGAHAWIFFADRVSARDARRDDRSGQSSRSGHRFAAALMRIRKRATLKFRRARSDSATPLSCAQYPILAIFHFQSRIARD